MKTIGEYKKQFIDLLVELEKEHNCHVSNVQVSHPLDIFKCSDIEISSYECEITIE